MRRAVAERIADHIADWHHRGLIDNDLAALLRRRYSVDATMGRAFLRWLGFLAVFMLGMSLLGLIGMALGAIAVYIAATKGSSRCGCRAGFSSARCRSG